MDLTFRTGQGRFNYRVGAIIIRDHKILMVKNEKVPYYYSVGGRVRYNESCEEAVIREVREELGIEFEVDRAVFFHENFFFEAVTQERFHEIALYFLMKIPAGFENMVCNSFTEDGAEETLHWIEIDKLDQVAAFPAFFAKELSNIPDHIKHIVHFQN